MISVKIKDKDPNEVMDIVRELRQQGLVQGKDFDFAFHQAKYNNDGWEEIEPKFTMFMFYTEKYATMFAIKWSA